MIKFFSTAILVITFMQSAAAQAPAAKPATKPAANLAAMTLQCQKQLGPGAVAQEDFSQGTVNYFCNCAAPYVWNEKGDGCKRPQISIVPNNNNQAGNPPVPPATNPGNDQQVPPDDSDDAPVATQPPPGMAPPPAMRPQPPVVRQKPPARKKPRVRDRRKKPRYATPRPRGRDRVRPRNGPAIARSFCRRKYGRRLVRVEPKRSKFYCYYKGKRSLGNSQTRWKKFKYRNIR